MFALSLPLTHPEFAGNADKSQLLGVDLRLAGSFRKQVLDESISTNPYQLLQAGVEGIVILVQKLSLKIKRGNGIE